MTDTATIAKKIKTGEGIWGFHRFSQAWYFNRKNQKDDFIEQISMGVYVPEGGCYSEFMLAWNKFDNGTVARLKCYDDSWRLFPLMTDLFSMMAEVGVDSRYDAISPDDFTNRLVAMGWVDLTHREQGDD